MLTKVKYAVLTGDEQFEIREGNLKTRGTPIIKVSHIGVCGTDMSYWKLGDHYKNQVIGHEFSGTIVDPSNNPNFQVGDRVTGYTQNIYNEHCGHCDNCLNGDFEHCSNKKVLTWKGGELNHPGCYSELTTWFPNSIFKLPDTVSNEEAALIEPLSVCLHAVSITDIRPNDKILILGGGMIGLGIAEWARSFGAGTIAITEVNEEKIKAIKGFGSTDHVIKGDAPDLAEQLSTASDGGFDVVFDCVGFPSAIAAGLSSFKPEVRAKKQFTAVALPHRAIEMNYDDIVLKEIVLRGSKGHTPDEFQTVIKAMAAKKIDVSKYITKIIPFAELQEGFEELKAIGGTSGKAVIVMG